MNSNDIQHAFELILDLRSTFQLTCKVMMCSLRPAEIHTMVGESFLHLQYLKSYWSKASWMCNGSLKFDELWSLSHWPEVKSDCMLQKGHFKRSRLLFFHRSSYNSSWATVSYLEHYFKAKIWQPTQLGDVTVTWPDLVHIWNFAHICARYSFEAIRNFASLSRRVSELLQKNKGGGAKKCPPTAWKVKHPAVSTKKWLTVTP